MSVIFIVAPAVVASWPLLCGAVSGAAAILGYKALKSQNSKSIVGDSESWVEVSLEGSQVLAESMQRQSEFVIQKDDITAAFRRSADGRCSVHVSGNNKTEEELSAAGRELLGRVTQQYAYNKTVSELKRQGFTVTNEEVAADNTIRINVCKYV